jgi:clan AA aspartic protease
MKGIVDNEGRALLRLAIVASDAFKEVEVDLWIDTGLTGDLVLPRKLIELLGLTRSSSVDGVLADGTETVFDIYSCWLDWFDTKRDLEVIATDGETALLGVGLLLGNELHIDYANAVVTLLPAKRNS